MVRRGHGDRSSIGRVRKWDIKLKPDIVAKQLQATKRLGLRSMERYQATYQFIMEAVQEIVAEHTKYVGLHHELVSYMLHLWRCQHRYRGEALQVMVDATFLYWRARGFDEEVLRVAATRLGLKVSSWDVLLSRLGVDMALKDAFRQALEEASTLRTPTIAQNPLDKKFYYDAEGRLSKIVITDLVTGKVKTKYFEYDAEGRLIQVREEVE